MNNTLEKFNTIARIASLISFLWIGLNTYLDFFAGEIRPSSGNLIRVTIPYIVFALSVLVMILRQKRISVQHHAILSMWSIDSTPPCKAIVSGQSEVELFSSKKHFEIGLLGVFSGPELTTIKKLFRESEIRIYAIVCEYSRPSTNDLCWLQVAEYGVLDSTGHYTARAYLGGAFDEDSAKEGEVFSLTIFLPTNKDHKFNDYSVYSKESLPKGIFISKPLFVRVKRRELSH